MKGRCEDMRPYGKGVLSVDRDNEGDYHIQIMVDDRQGSDDFENYHRVSLEFVSHCSRSPETIKALENLMLAIEKDNEQKPDMAWPPERG